MSEPQILVKKIINAVCGCSHELGHEILPEMVTGKARDKNTVRVRHMVMFVAYRHYNFTLHGLGKLLNRDHASVVHGNRQMADLIDRYAEHGRLYMAVAVELGLKPLDWLNPCLFEKLQEVKKPINNPLDKPKNPIESDEYVIPIYWSPEEKVRRKMALMYPGVAPGPGDGNRAKMPDQKDKYRHFNQPTSEEAIRKKMKADGLKATRQHFKRALTKDAMLKEMRRQGRL